MKYARITLLIALLALVFTMSAVLAADAPFFFIQLADPQLGFNNQNKDMIPEIEHFTKAVEHINRLKPAFVLISGDTAHKATHDPVQIRAFWRIAHEIDPKIPLHIAPGNHDMAAGTAADVNSYKKLFGPDHYSFSHNGSYFIVLNSGIFGKDGDAGIRNEQRKWLESELEAAHAKNAAHIFVCGHHPWFLNTSDEPNRYENVPLAYRQDYLDLMKRYKVEYALSGHLHHTQIAKDGDLTIVAGMPLSKSVAKPPVVGLTIWKVYKNRIEFQFCPLDQVPASVKL